MTFCRSGRRVETCGGKGSGDHDRKDSQEGYYAGIFDSVCEAVRVGKPTQSDAAVSWRQCACARRVLIDGPGNRGSQSRARIPLHKG